MRKQLLNVALNKENNPESLVSEIEAKDKKFLKRKLTALENEKDDAEEELEKRLSETTGIDESVVESLFAKVEATKTKINLYEKFQTYFNSEK